MTDSTAPEQTANSPFAALPNNPSFPAIEHDILFVDRLDAFHQSNSRADGEPLSTTASLRHRHPALRPPP